MIRINLLGHEPAKPKGGPSMPEFELGGGENVGFALAVVLTLVVLAGAWWYQAGRVDDLRRELANAQQTRDELADIAARVREVQDRTALVEQKLEVIVELKRNQSGPVLLLDELNRMVPDGVWFTQLTLSQGDLNITGMSLSEVQVTDFLEALRLSSDFADEFLVVSEDTGDAVRFQITVRFVPLAPAPATPADQGAAAGSAGGPQT